MNSLKDFWKRHSNFVMNQGVLIGSAFWFSILCTGFNINVKKVVEDPEWVTYVATLYIGVLLTFREIWLAQNFGVTLQEAFGQNYAWRDDAKFVKGAKLNWDDIEDDEVVIGDFVGRKFDWGAMTIVNDKHILYEALKDKNVSLIKQFMKDTGISFADAMKNDQLKDVSFVKQLQRPSKDKLKNQKSLSDGKIVYLSSQRLRKHSLPAYALVLKTFPAQGNSIPLNKWEIRHIYVHTDREKVEEARKEAREGKVDGKVCKDLRGVDGERNFRILDNIRIVMYGDELRLAVEPSFFEEEEVLERGPNDALEKAMEVAENHDIESADSILNIIHKLSMQDSRDDFFESDDVVQDYAPSENRKYMKNLVHEYEVKGQGIIAHLINPKRTRYVVMVGLIAVGIAGIVATIMDADFKIVQAFVTGLSALYVTVGIILCDYIGAIFSPRSLITGQLRLKRGNEPQEAIKQVVKDTSDKIDKKWACYAVEAVDGKGGLILPPAETRTVLEQEWRFKWCQEESKILAFRANAYYEVEKRSSKNHPLPEWRGVRLWHIESLDPVRVDRPESLKSLSVKRGLYFS